MRKDKEKAIEMRKSGKSYREIWDALKVPLSTLSDWFSDIEWSKDMAKRLAEEMQVVHTSRLRRLDKIRGEHLDRVYAEARKEAEEELGALRYNPLFIAGLMLYWGEGDKGRIRGGLRFTNTDPEMVRLYVHFLLRACRIPVQKIKAQVLIYPDLDGATCRTYWARASGLPESHFTKCTTIIGRHKTRRLSWGVCLIIVSSTYTKEKMLEWLRLFPKELMNKAYYENIRE